MGTWEEKIVFTECVQFFMQSNKSEINKLLIQEWMEAIQRKKSRLINDKISVKCKDEFYIFISL